MVMSLQPIAKRKEKMNKSGAIERGIRREEKGERFKQPQKCLCKKVTMSGENPLWSRGKGSSTEDRRAVEHLEVRGYRISGI